MDFSNDRQDAEERLAACDREIPAVRVAGSDFCSRCAEPRASTDARRSLAAAAVGCVLLLCALVPWEIWMRSSRASSEAQPGVVGAEPLQPGPQREQSIEHLRRGKSLVERREFWEAEREFRRAVEFAPGDPLAWAQLGAVLAILERSEEALDSYLHALDLDPACWLAHYNLAVLRGRQGEVEAALASAGAALAALAPGDGPERSAVIRGLLEEPALAGVRRDPRFAGVLASAPAVGGVP